VGSTDDSLLGIGLGLHVALALVRVVQAAPPAVLGTGDVEIAGLLSLSALAASCLTAARLTAARHRPWRAGLDAVGLAAVAYLTAGALDGPSLVVAWTLQGLALARLSARGDDGVALAAGMTFLVAAFIHVIVAEAPPSGLVQGVPDLGAAAVTLGGLSAAALDAGRRLQEHQPARSWLLAAGAGALLYLASVAIITAFQPEPGQVADTVLDLTVRQQGQVLLSALWSVVGVAALIVGLRTKRGRVRSGALVLLFVTVGKVFLYDLSTLTSIYRVISFMVLGLLLLAGAFAYQRLRPPPLPDFRTLHRSQR
jgi:hypothetical protein